RLGGGKKLSINFSSWLPRVGEERMSWMKEDHQSSRRSLQGTLRRPRMGVKRVNFTKIILLVIPIRILRPVLLRLGPQLLALLRVQVIPGLATSVMWVSKEEGDFSC